MVVTSRQQYGTHESHGLWHSHHQPYSRLVHTAMLLTAAELQNRVLGSHPLQSGLASAASEPMLQLLLLLPATWWQKPEMLLPLLCLRSAGTNRISTPLLRGCLAQPTCFPTATGVPQGRVGNASHEISSEPNPTQESLRAHTRNASQRGRFTP